MTISQYPLTSGTDWSEYLPMVTEGAIECKSKNTWVTVVSISGQGFLHAAVMFGKSSSVDSVSSEFRLSIDGVVVLHGKNTSNNVSGFVLESSLGSGYINSSISAGIRFKDSYRTLPFAGVYSSLRSVEAVAGTNPCICVEGGIGHRFNSSVVLEAKVDAIGVVNILMQASLKE